MNDEKRAEIKAFAIANKVTDAKVLEHYYIFGTLDFGSYEQGKDAPRSEHYSIDELKSIIDEIAKDNAPKPVIEEPVI